MATTPLTLQHDGPLPHERDATARDLFARDYTSSVTRFLFAAQTANAEVTPLRLRSTAGPNYEPLSINCAFLGTPDPKDVLVHIAAVHGIEGELGATFQIEALNAKPHLPADCATVFIHALNPFGRAHGTRVNEKRVDLNRNFSGSLLRGIPLAYQEYDELFNPASEVALRQSLQRMDTFFRDKGDRKVQRQILNAFGIAQYENPEKLSFGGKILSEGLVHLKEYLKQRLPNAQRIVVVDVHTGLGPRGECTYLTDSWGKAAASAEKALVATVKQHGAQGNFNEIKKVVPYYPYLRGTIGQGIRELFPDATVLLLAQEMGTEPPKEVLKALIAENFATRSQNEEEISRTRAVLEEVFTPRDLAWQHMTLPEVSRGYKGAAQFAFANFKDHA